MKKRAVSILLSLALLLCAACARKTSYESGTAHTELLFSELPDGGEDAQLELARAKELLFRIERGEIEGTAAQEALDARADAFERLSTDAAIAYVRYCLDVTDEEQKARYDTLSLTLDALSCVLTDIALLLKDDPALKDRYDAETVAALERADRLSDLSIQPLLERERELVGQYEGLSEALTVEYNGTLWTGDAIVSDASLSAEDFETLYESYMQLFNAEAGAIFLELIAVRNAIAKRLGFDTYAEYAYVCLDRDYTPEDAARLSEAVKREIVPLFSDLRDPFYRAVGSVYGIEFQKEPTLTRIGEAIVSLFPEFSEPWTYMIEHEMFDLGTDTVRMPGSFVTYFPAYGAPYLFSSWTGGFDMPSTVAHEFGHYASFYLNGDALENGNVLDLAEIDSQGLELLTVLRYDTLYGDRSEAAEDVQLFYALYALIDGCAEDAFQRFAYEHEGVTIAELNAAYGRIIQDYGLDRIGVESRSWTQIRHTFQSPFYYVSYATSMAAALELYAKSKTDPEAAKNAYRTVLMRKTGAGFLDTLKEAGLRDPFDPDALLKTARELGSVRRNRMTE